MRLGNLPGTEHWNLFYSSPKTSQHPTTVAASSLHEIDSFPAPNGTVDGAEGLFLPPFHPVINEHSNNIIGTMIHMTENLVDAVPYTRNPSPQQLPFDDVLRVVESSPSHASLSIDLDVRDLVIVGGFDPETALVPPLCALRDLFDHEVLYGPLWQFLTGEIEALLASSAESARSHANDTYYVLRAARHGAQHIVPRSSRVLSAQFRRLVKAAESDTVLQLSQISRQRWHTFTTNTGTLKLALECRSTFGGGKTVYLQYVPKIRSGRKGYGISILLEIRQSPSAIGSILRNIRPYTVQPSSASVFTYIKDGNISELGKAFAGGQASVIDHDEEGWGLLVVSIAVSFPRCHQAANYIVSMLVRLLF